MSFVLDNDETKWWSLAKINHFLCRNGEKRALVSAIGFRMLLSFNKMQIIETRPRVELQFGINGSPSIVVNAIKDVFF